MKENIYIHRGDGEASTDPREMEGDWRKTYEVYEDRRRDCERLKQGRNAEGCQRSGKRDLEIREENLVRRRTGRKRKRRRKTEKRKQEEEKAEVEEDEVLNEK